MVDQSIKNQKQTLAAQQASPLDKALSPNETAAKAGSSPLKELETQSIIKSQQATTKLSVGNTRALEALFRVTDHTNAAPQTNQPKHNTAAARQRPKHLGRDTTKNTGNSSTEELRERNAIQAANSLKGKGTVAAASNRGALSRSAGTMASEPLDGQSEFEDGAAQHSLASTNGVEEAISTGIRYGIGTSNQEERTSSNTQISPEQALNDINLDSSLETIKLMDIVGPEAILNFTEALREVWVMLDENATRQLDVIARRPATLSGSSMRELLAVESPQGIHFVAFLKNKNDFEVLATFDRRAILPQNPSRQLLEAGLMSYEQLDAVFKEGAQKIEQSAKAIAVAQGTNNFVFNEIQRLMVQEKRRRRKFRQMMDYFIDQLDDIDLEEDSMDTPFVPKNLKDKGLDLEQAELEAQIEEEFEAEDRAKNGFALKTEDSDYN